MLDEPLNGLDPTSRSALKALLRQISRNGTTIFFSSHILSDVQDIAGRIGIINRGRILRIGTMDELQSHLSPGLIIEIHLSGDSQAAAERLRLPACV